MLKRMFLTLMVMTGLTGLYGLYALLVTSRLVPSELTAQERQLDELDEPKAVPPAGNIEDAQRFLSDASWAARAKFQIRLAKGVLYSESWQSKDEARNVFEFRPFAMIWFDTPTEADGEANEPADGQPITLVSERGLVRFATKFDPVNQKIGRVIGGKLEGEVTVAGPDGLTMRGRDFFFDESTMELRSDEPVAFTYQQHRGTAEGLKAELLPSTQPPRPDQLLNIGGFRRVTLRKHVVMDLVSREGPLHVTCEEGCDVLPLERVVSFQINVQGTQTTAQNRRDQFRGDDLLLVFDDPAKRGPHDDPRSRGDAPTVVPLSRGPAPPSYSAAGPESHDPLREALSPAARDSTQTLRELRLTGRRVELISETHELTVLATSLMYDVPTRTVKLAAISPTATSKPQELTSVIVRHQPTGTELSSPYLEFIHDEQGQIVSATGRGAGRLRRRTPGSDQIDFAAQWHNRFTLQQVLDSDMDLLTLIGRAVVEQPARDTGLKADQILLWYDRPSTVHSRTADRSARSSDQTHPLVAANDTVTRSVPSDTPREFRPRHLQAQDHVAVVSPQMNGQAKRLIVDFSSGAATPRTLTNSANARPRVKPTSGRPTESASAPAEPLQLSAELIRAKVQLAGGSSATGDVADFQAELTEVWTEGNVDIQQPRDGETEPLHLTGDRLHLRNASRDGQQVVHIIGQPAVIRARGFDLEGNQIFLDRPRNRTWVEGAGALRLPVENDFENRKLSRPALLTVWWQEKMLFDGQTATFLQDVKAALNDSRLQCEEMEVVLTERLSFQQNADTPPQTEVQRVICKDGVEIDQTLYVDKDLTEIRRGRFAQLTLDQLSGRMEGVGPGEIALWRPGRGKRAALAPRAVAQANRPLESEVSNWEFTRVTFFGKTIGNLHDRQTKFQDRVHILYGPVAHPLDTIDADHLPKDGGYMECDSLQILQRKESAAQKPYIELEAKGNAKLEGRTFNARADEITFDESKELYTLRAIGNRQVTIWRQTTPAGEPSEASAKTMRFIPSSNYLKADLTTGIRGSN